MILVIIVFFVLVNSFFLPSVNASGTEIVCGFVARSVLSFLYALRVPGGVKQQRAKVFYLTSAISTEPAVTVIVRLRLI